MKYSELIQLYFERSNALQAYWTLYVAVLGGLLAFSSLRKQPAMLTTIIVGVLFALFAYENLSAIHDTNDHRLATLELLKASPADAPEVIAARKAIEPVLRPASDSSETTTHVTSDVLTIAALAAMELRRRRYADADGRARLAQPADQS